MSTEPTISLVEHNVHDADTPVPTRLLAFPSKKRNVYVVGSFLSVGGFLFGADTGEQFMHLKGADSLS